MYIKYAHGGYWIIPRTVIVLLDSSRFQKRFAQLDSSNSDIKVATFLEIIISITFFFYYFLWTLFFVRKSEGNV